MHTHIIPMNNVARRKILDNDFHLEIVKGQNMGHHETTDGTLTTTALCTLPPMPKKLALALRKLSLATVV